MKIIPIVTACLSLLPLQAISADITVNHSDIVKGNCEATSHIAEGKLGDDLTKRRSQFYCDSAVISYFDSEYNHVMVQFSDSQSVTNQLLGYAGYMDEKKEILTVEKVYIANKPYKATDVACKFFFKNKHMSNIVCGGAIDIGDRRTVPVVIFTLKPGQ